MENVSKKELMCEIMAVDFAITDIKLYLDTHPCDEEAITLYNALVKKRAAMHESYQCMFGPIIAETYDKSTKHWDWIKDPWPWDKEEI